MKRIVFTILIIVNLVCNTNAQYYSSSYDVVSPFPMVAGTDNNGFGFLSLDDAGTGSFRNTAVGFEAMKLHRSGFENVGIGARSLFNTGSSGSLPLGNANTAVGSYALYSNLDGDYSVATGFQSLYQNNSGSYNTAFGFESLYSNTTGSYNTATGYKSLFTNNGNGTDVGQDNTATGHSALYSNLAGQENTASGFESLWSNSDGKQNTAAGYRSLFSNNLFVSALGQYNTAIGASALENNISGLYNTATGYQSLFGNNMTGISNSAFGAKALWSNIAGFENTAVGYQALYENTSGFHNTAIGLNSLFKNSTGKYNTAVGVGALVNNLTGELNTAIGYRAAANNLTIGQTNHKSTYVGALTANVFSTAGENITMIGYFAQNWNQASHAVRFGSFSGVTAVETQSKWIVASDGRFKTNVSEEDVVGLDFILKLRPVSYNFDTQKLMKHVTSDLPDSIKKHYDLSGLDTDEGRRQSGFLAQEVEQAALEVGYNFDAIKKPEGKNGYYGLAYSLFVVPLIKASQEQDKLILLQDESVLALKKKVEELDLLIESNKAARSNNNLNEQINCKVADTHLEINYAINNLKDKESATLGIYNANGTEITVYEIKENSGNVIIEIPSIGPGKFIVAIGKHGAICAIDNFEIK